MAKMKTSVLTKLFPMALALSMAVTAHAQSTVSKDILITKGERVKKEISSVSGDVTLSSGVIAERSVSTVSGDVQLGSKTNVGDVNTVSGDVDAGKRSKVSSIETVSGDIHLYEAVEVDGLIESVSGDVTCDGGSEVKGDIQTVSGDIEMDDTRVRGDLATVSGDISLYNESFIDGDILINRKNSMSPMPMGKLEILIDMNSTVKGSIKVKEDNTNVVVILANGGKVKGEIINAKVVKR